MNIALKRERERERANAAFKGGLLYTLHARTFGTGGCLWTLRYFIINVIFYPALSVLSSLSLSFSTLLGILYVWEVTFCCTKKKEKISNSSVGMEANKNVKNFDDIALLFFYRTSERDGAHFFSMRCFKRVI